MSKIPVGVLGATGMVGQSYIALLTNHPWFEVKYLAASPRSAGRKYRESLVGRWHLRRGYDAALIDEITVEDANDVEAAVAAEKKGGLAFVFSALEMDKDAIQKLEESYAAAGIPVVSNASANRWTLDVPMLIPEVNPGHTDIIPLQQKARGWKKGFIVVKPNCSIQSYMIPVWALLQAGYEVKRMIVNTMQAVSGAGYPGVPSLDLIDNIVPFIGGEEEKSEKEPLKILGAIEGTAIKNAAGPLISAHCNRVPVSDGHTATVSMEFGNKKPSVEQIKEIWKKFRALPQELALPFAPEQPIIVREEANRPQPGKDRDADKGMAVSVGRIRSCPVFDIRFVGLSHNTIRGAAGGGILNAELLKAKGFLG
ncbi:MAG: aspartate-semialdehyde dehydrogenase [Spirochaetaceae bacterium]|jgi:aspartate-semialdehyde dehydrogenase|nr:aspartate-semialdehyde dehydrogenase [Spirochaetaceae bacterium]